MTGENVSFIIGSIPVKRLKVNVGIAPDGQIVGINNVAGDNVRISLIPGKWAHVEKTNPSTGAVVTLEFVLGPLGWDYERMIMS